MVVVGGLQFGHAAVVFTPTSLERGGVRWSQVALADLGDVDLASSLGGGGGRKKQCGTGWCFRIWLQQTLWERYG